MRPAANEARGVNPALVAALDEMRANGEGGHIEKLSGFGESPVAILNRAMGSIALAILFVAIFMPFVIGRAGTPRVLVWPVFAGLVFAGGLILVARHSRWSFALLLFALIFFFASCSANLQLHLD